MFKFWKLIMFDCDIYWKIILKGRGFRCGSDEKMMRTWFGLEIDVVGLPPLHQYRMRLQRRLYGIYVISFLIFMIFSNCKLAFFFAKYFNKSLKTYIQGILGIVLLYEFQVVFTISFLNELYLGTDMKGLDPSNHPPVLINSTLGVFLEMW